VDPDLDAIKVYRLADGRYTEVSELTLRDGDVLTTPLLPGSNCRSPRSSPNPDTRTS
jgi:hypothetical protein